MYNSNSRSSRILYLVIFTIVLNVVVAAITLNIESPLSTVSYHVNLKDKDIKNFSSEEEFRKYLASAPDEGSSIGGGFAMMRAKTAGVAPSWDEATNAPAVPSGISSDMMYKNPSGEPDRF